MNHIQNAAAQISALVLGSIWARLTSVSVANWTLSIAVIALALVSLRKKRAITARLESADALFRPIILVIVSAVLVVEFFPDTRDALTLASLAVIAGVTLLSQARMAEDHGSKLGETTDLLRKQAATANIIPSIGLQSAQHQSEGEAIEVDLDLTFEEGRATFTITLENLNRTRADRLIYDIHLPTFGDDKLTFEIDGDDVVEALPTPQGNTICAQYKDLGIVSFSNYRNATPRSIDNRGKINVAITAADDLIEAGFVAPLLLACYWQNGHFPSTKNASQLYLCNYRPNGEDENVARA